MSCFPIGSKADTPTRPNTVRKGTAVSGHLGIAGNKKIVLYYSLRGPPILQMFPIPMRMTQNTAKNEYGICVANDGTLFLIIALTYTIWRA